MLGSKKSLSSPRLTHGPGHGTTYRCSELSVIPLQQIQFFCPCVYPLMIQLQSYERQRNLYFKGHLGLQNWFITGICSWRFLVFELQAEPPVTPFRLTNVLILISTILGFFWKCVIQIKIPYVLLYPLLSF